MRIEHDFLVNAAEFDDVEIALRERRLEIEVPGSLNFLVHHLNELPVPADGEGVAGIGGRYSVGVLGQDPLHSLVAQTEVLDCSVGAITLRLDGTGTELESWRYCPDIWGGRVGWVGWVLRQVGVGPVTLFVSILVHFFLLFPPCGRHGGGCSLARMSL